MAYRSRARKTPEPVARIGLITLWKHTMMRRGRVRAVYPNSMSQQTTNPGGTDDLAQELETLLAEIDQSARAGDRRRAGRLHEHTGDGGANAVRPRRLRRCAAARGAGRGRRAACEPARARGLAARSEHAAPDRAAVREFAAARRGARRRGGRSGAGG